MDTPKVGSLIGSNLNLDGVGSHAVSPDDFHSFVQRPPSRPVVVKQITSNQHHITLQYSRKSSEL